MYSLAVVSASFLFMGVSILIGIGLRDFNSMGCDTPTQTAEGQGA